MHAEFNELRPFVHDLKLVNIPFTIDEILNEVANADWRSWQSVNDTRYKTWKPFGPISQSLNEFFNSKQFQEQLLDTVSHRIEFYRDYWSSSREQLLSKTSPIFEYNVDTPHFIMRPHLDNRELMIVGMCHFIRDDDPNQSTTFYSSEQCVDPIRMPTGFGIGWMGANLHNTWHSGHNMSNQNRFSIKFGTKMNFK